MLTKLAEAQRERLDAHRRALLAEHAGQVVDELVAGASVEELDASVEDLLHEVAGLDHVAAQAGLIVGDDHVEGPRLRADDLHELEQGGAALPEGGPGTGRGVTLMRTILDEVRYNAAGNEVTLVKRRARLTFPEAGEGGEEASA